MFRRPLLHCLLLAGVSLTACGGFDEPADVATQDAATDETEVADASTGDADFSGMVTIPAVAGAVDSFGFSSSEQVWVRRGDLAVTMENSSATHTLSLGLLGELLPALG